MRRIGMIIGLLALLALLPQVVTGSYFQHILVVWLIFSIVAVSLNIIVGYLGELSFGHPAFFGLGAYASAMLTLYGHSSFLLGLIGAIVVAAAFGLVVGSLSLRTQGPQFAILTFGFSGVIYTVVNAWQGFTNGPLGITRIPRPDLFGMPVATTTAGYYYLALTVLTACIVFSYALTRSRVGRAFVSIRENASLAASVGINVFAYKLLGFTIGSAMAGIGGSLYAHYVNVITPELMSPFYMVAFIVMVIVGGKGTVSGPIIGGLFYVIMLEILRVLGPLRLVIFSLALILVVVFMPGGIVPYFRQMIAARRNSRPALPLTKYAKEE